MQRRAEEHLGVGIIVADILLLLDGFAGAATSFVRRSDNGVAQKVVQDLGFYSWEFRPPL